MDTDLIEQMNNILTRMAEIKGRQNNYEEKMDKLKERIHMDLVKAKEELIDINQDCEDLFYHVDEFAKEFSKFSREMFSPPESPILAGYGQDPYEEEPGQIQVSYSGDLQPKVRYERERASSSGDLQPQVRYEKGHSQASSNSGGLQPKVNIQIRGSEQTASQPVPPSGIKQSLNVQQGITLRPQTARPIAEISSSQVGINQKLKDLQKDLSKKKVSFIIEKTLHAWEKDYFDFAKLVYEMRQGSTFLQMSEKNSIYPRISCLPDSSNHFVKKLSDFGFLDRLYPSTNLNELKDFPTDFLEVVKDFSNGENIYLRFYSISPEMEDNTVFEAFHLITMGYVTQDFQLRPSGQEFKIPFFNRKWMKYRRALGIKVINSLLRDFYTKSYEVYGHGKNWMIILQGEEGTRSRLLEEKMSKISLDKWEGSSDVISEACRLMKHQHHNIPGDRKN